MRIARRFNAGTVIEKLATPEGTAENDAVAMSDDFHR